MSTVSAIQSVLPDRRARPGTRQSSVATKSFGADEKIFQALPVDCTINQAAFDQLLCWLCPDRETAGREYEIIRRKLITIFAYRGCAFPEELADETIDRVARKLPEIGRYYIGNPASYFYGVAKKIYLEYCRRIYARPVPPPPTVNEDSEGMLQLLDCALGKLDLADRELILSYYQGDGRSKIDHRKALAAQMGLRLDALRLRVYRIRSQLRSQVDKASR